MKKFLFIFSVLVLLGCSSKEYRAKLSCDSGWSTGEADVVIRGNGVITWFTGGVRYDRKMLAGEVCSVKRWVIEEE